VGVWVCVLRLAHHLNTLNHASGSFCVLLNVARLHFVNENGSGLCVCVACGCGCGWGYRCVCVLHLAHHLNTRNNISGSFCVLSNVARLQFVNKNRMPTLLTINTHRASAL